MCPEVRGGRGAREHGCSQRRAQAGLLLPELFLRGQVYSNKSCYFCPRDREPQRDPTHFLEDLEDEDGKE